MNREHCLSDRQGWLSRPLVERSGLTSIQSALTLVTRMEVRSEIPVNSDSPGGVEQRAMMTRSGSNAYGGR